VRAICSFMLNHPILHFVKMHFPVSADLLQIFHFQIIVKNELKIVSL
jgi:hypothetical protein